VLQDITNTQKPLSVCDGQSQGNKMRPSALPLAVPIPRAITTVWLVVFYVLQFDFINQYNLDLYLRNSA
jgi:hypothetical protein